MIVKPHDYIFDALRNQYAIGAFNTSNLELTQAIIAAAAQRESAVIVQTSESAIKYAGLDVIVSVIKQVAAAHNVPVVINLDHGKSYKIAQRCIEAGYTAIMIDGSRETFADNIALTKSVVKIARQRGVWVEAELGAILGAEGMQELAGGKTPAAYLTKPSQVLEFVERTQIDALAVSVGTIHGAFTGQEYIRFELLEKIMTIVPDLPLVIHGASGIAADHLRRVARTNVCKINVDTEMRLAFMAAVKAYFATSHGKVDPREILAPARAAVQNVVMDKINTFASNHKAKLV